MVATIRIALAASLALLLSANSCSSSARIGAPAEVSRIIAMDAQITVPQDFVGIHLHRWPHAFYPGTTRSPAPTYRYGTVRSLNYDGALWFDVHPAPGKFQFAQLDGWVERHHRDGKTLIYTLYGTPSWLTARPYVKDKYFREGGDSRPRDLAPLREFVTELVKRYNGDGTRRIRYLEVWNEPDFVGGPYWRDSASDLAALARAVYQSAKAVDPEIRILYPSFVDLFGGPKVFRKMVTYARASDGADGRGVDWADAMTFHHYHYENDTAATLLDTIEGVRMTMREIGREHWDLYLTEIGAGPQWTRNSPPLAQKIRTIEHWMMVAAAAGVRMIGLYSHETDHLGRPAEHPEVAAAITRMHDALVGRTIRTAAILRDGSVWIRFADGETLRK